MSTQFPISVYIIAYNNEAKIRHTLEGVSGWADEIIVIDSYSTDKTLDICKEFPVRIVQHEFKGFGELRNFAVAQTKYDWVLSVDSDEYVTDELKQEITRTLENTPKYPAYHIPRINYFIQYKITHGGFYPDYRTPQFFSKHKMTYNSEDMGHEGYVVDGEKGYFKEHIIQYPFLTLGEFLAKMERYSTLMAQDRVAKGETFKVSKLLFSPLFLFFKMYVVRRGFLDGLPGLVLAVLYIHYTILKYVKIWDLTHNLPVK